MKSKFVECAYFSFKKEIVALFQRLTEDKTLQKLLTKSFRKILHDIGTEEMRKEDDGNSGPRLRSLKVMRNIYYLYLSLIHI